jgi:RES domain-containing protein
MTPHPDSDRIKRAMQRCLASAGAWSGDLYRFSTPKWSTTAELLTGAGALKAGGRWHPIGLCRAVYASLDPLTAFHESLAHYKRYGLSVRTAMPKTVNAVAAQLHHVLDLTEGRLRQRLMISERRIVQERWWLLAAAGQEALTQAVGRIAWGTQGRGAYRALGGPRGTQGSGLLPRPQAPAQRPDHH